MRKLCGVLMAMAVAACAANPNSDELSGESGNRSTAEGGRNPSTAVSTRPIEPGEVCPNGGVSIDVGIDENANGFLDEAEVDNTVSVCNGAAGPDGQDGGISELDIREVPAGDADCPNGGQLIVVGIDQNHDGELTDSEIESFHYICNGEDGIDGEDGEDASGGGSETGGNGGESGDDEESDDSEENGNNNGDGEFDEIENDNSGLGNVLYARTFNFDENFGGSAIISRP